MSLQISVMNSDKLLPFFQTITPPLLAFYCKGKPCFALWEYATLSRMVLQLTIINQMLHVEALQVLLAEVKFNTPCQHVEKI